MADVGPGTVGVVAPERHIWVSVILCLVLVPLALAGTPSPALASARTSPHVTVIPCPHGVQPDRVTVSWRLQELFGQVTTGQRVVRQRAVVRQLYQRMCSTVLSRVAAAFCPAARSKSTYHLTFLYRRRSLLGIVETVMGCEDYWVQGRHNLGSAWGTPLPRGIPRAIW